jgi:hypothetical protein
LECKEPYVFGVYKARWSDKRGLWEISSNKGGKGSRKTRELARQRILELEATGALAQSSNTGTAIPPLARKSIRESTMKSSEELAEGSKPKRKAPVGGWLAGPGRGNTGSRVSCPKQHKPCPVAAALSDAKVAVLNQASLTKNQLARQITKMVHVNTSLKRKLDDANQQRDALATIVMDQYGLTGPLADAEIKRRKTQAAELVGEGYQTEVSDIDYVYSVCQFCVFILCAVSGSVPFAASVSKTTSTAIILLLITVHSLSLFSVQFSQPILCAISVSSMHCAVSVFVLCSSLSSEFVQCRLCVYSLNLFSALSLCSFCFSQYSHRSPSRNIGCMFWVSSSLLVEVTS